MPSKPKTLAALVHSYTASMAIDFIEHDGFRAECVDLLEGDPVLGLSEDQERKVVRALRKFAADLRSRANET